MKPSLPTKVQWVKVLKALGYLTLSSVISGLAVLVQNQPELFGVYLAPVNLALVILKQVFSKE